MNEFEAVSDRQLEGLIDGELSSQERRQVLMALDRDEDGWRRLALAFLESQAIRESLSHAYASSTKSGDVPSTSEPLVTLKQSLPDRTPLNRQAAKWRPVVAMAMCGLVMFGLGRLSISPVRDRVQTAALPQPSPETCSPTSPSQATKDHQKQETLIADAGTPQEQHQQTLRLELGDGQGGASQEVEVPVVENSNIRAEDLMTAPPVISDAVQRALLRSGRRVYEQRQLYEVTLEDGRRGVVPISDVFVENAGWDVYQ